MSVIDWIIRLIKLVSDDYEFIAKYCVADVLFRCLGAHGAHEKELPSKVFEYAALGKPELASVAGLAVKFVREELSKAVVLAPCDVTAAVDAFESLDLVNRVRPEFQAKYARIDIS